MTSLLACSARQAIMVALENLGVSTDTAETPQVANCPHCDARLMFHRDRTPFIDSCGFESYSLECQECGVPLGGIVDPCDDALLLSIVPR